MRVAKDTQVKLIFFVKGGSSPLRSGGSCDSQAERLDHISGGQRQSNDSRKTLGSQGTY